MILSLQGCMAVGKTTAVRYLQEHAPYIHISPENNAEIVEEVKRRGLDKTKYEDYLEIQRLWLAEEVRRYARCEGYPCTVMDFGAEEIEFHTINYPISQGYQWEIETALADELEAVRACGPTRILFLDASDEVLRRRKQGDGSRTRNSFDFYLEHMMPLKRQWFEGRENVDVLPVDELTPEEVGAEVKAWCDRCIAEEQ